MMPKTSRGVAELIFADKPTGFLDALLLLFVASYMKFAECLGSSVAKHHTARVADVGDNKLIAKRQSSDCRRPGSKSDFVDIDGPQPLISIQSGFERSTHN